METAYRGLKVGSVEAHNQPGEGGAVHCLQLTIDEVVLGAALAEVNLSGKLDEEDWTVAEGVTADGTCSQERHTAACVLLCGVPPSQVQSTQPGRRLKGDNCS